MLVFAEPSMESDNSPRTSDSPVDEQLVPETPIGSNCERKADAASSISTNKGSQSQGSNKRKMSEASCDSRMKNMIFFTLLGHVMLYRWNRAENSYKDTNIHLVTFVPLVFY